MLNIRRGWWIPIGICIIVGIISLIPLNTGVDGTYLPYQSIIPLAPVSTILIWILAGLLYFLGRWSTGRPIKSPYR